MRFRFCCDADCPDWVLAEISTVSRLSSVKLKQLTTIVAQGLSNPPIDIEKAEKIFTESKLDSDLEIKRCIACLAFIIRSAIRAACDAVALGSELQQLGLPREHVQAIRKVYIEHAEALTVSLKEKSLKINTLKEITCSAVPSLDLVEINLKIDSITEKRVRVPRTVLTTILQDARQTLNTMEEIIASDHAL